jgi:hypothetical protein
VESKGKRNFTFHLVVDATYCLPFPLEEDKPGDLWALEYGHISRELTSMLTPGARITFTLKEEEGGV